MSSSFYGALLLLLVCCLCCCCFADDPATSQQLLSNLNAYRDTAGVPPLSYNAGAACLAENILEQLDKQECNNETEARTYPGLEQDLPDYTKFLSQCKLNLQNTTEGQILADCIPAVPDPAGTAAENFTRSQEYQSYLNSSSYTSVGIASEHFWFVLVLGSNSSKASFVQSNAAAAHTPLITFQLVLTAFLSLLLVVR